MLQCLIIIANIYHKFDVNVQKRFAFLVQKSMLLIEKQADFSVTGREIFEQTHYAGFSGILFR